MYKRQDVNISENEQVVEIEIVNELVRGNIALTKVDAEYTDTKLTGAVFEVYKDTNDNGELDSEDELIGTPVSYTHLDVYKRQILLYGAGGVPGRGEIPMIPVSYTHLL